MNTQKWLKEQIAKDTLGELLYDHSRSSRIWGIDWNFGSARGKAPSSYLAAVNQVYVAVYEGREIPTKGDPFLDRVATNAQAFRAAFLVTVEAARLGDVAAVVSALRVLEPTIPYFYLPQVRKVSGMSVTMMREIKSQLRG